MVETKECNRRSIRLAGYDYSQAGACFVTVCVNERRNLFGGIDDGKMVLNDAGFMVQAVWDEIPKYYDGVGVDIFQIMPNHIHGIITVGAGPRACPNGEQLNQGGEGQRGQPQGVAPTLSLGDIVGRFKSLTTTKYINGVKNNHWPPFNKNFWQRNYYEHVIRDENDLDRIREYIVNNPAKWQEDEYYVQ